MREIEGYEGLYAITEDGQVYSYISKRYLKPAKNHGGYLTVCLSSKNGERKRFYIHRLVAFAFIDNPNNYPQVNHKDENKENNNIDNLEWCTSKYNNNYGTHNKRSHENRKNTSLGNHPQARSVECVELHKIFSCAKEASLILGIDNSDIGKCCKGKLKTAGGYHWRYREVS